MQQSTWYRSTAYDNSKEIALLKKLSKGRTLIIGDYGVTLAKKLKAEVADKVYPSATFNTIISPWNGLHKRKDFDKIMHEFKRILKPGGKAIIEEADPTSEYVRILNKVKPKRTVRKDVKRMLSTYFKVKTLKLATKYTFESKEEFVEYFKNELAFHEDTKITKSVVAKLEKVAKKTVGEKSIIYICS